VLERAAVAVLAVQVEGQHLRQSVTLLTLQSLTAVSNSASGPRRGHLFLDANTSLIAFHNNVPGTSELRRMEGRSS